ncbi:MAG: hypothetical protein Q8914_12440 [Bacteroidota bacterium]|nr:hypothetical protein [Bacteroidota bacterium]
MKKLVLFVAVIVAVSFASCGNKKAAPAEPATEEVATEEAPAAAPAAADTAAAAATSTTEAAPVAE